MQNFKDMAEKVVGQFGFEYLDKKTCERCGITIELVRFRNPATQEVETQWQKCGCEVLDHMKEQQAAARQRKNERRLDLFKHHSLANKEISEASFATFVTDNVKFMTIARELERYAVEVEQGNVLLYGSYGTGKSHLAISATKLAMQHGKTALFINVPMLFNKIRGTYNKSSETTEDEIISVINSVDLLALDDIGADSGGVEWCQEKLFLILEGRQGKRTIFTTNLDSETIEKKIGGRNFDRMMNNTKAFTMVGESYRKKTRPTW